MSEIFKISFITFLLYSPISCCVKNVANKEINDKKEIWSITNNDIMMKALKKKNPKLYCMMILEHIIFFQFWIVLICKIMF